MYKLLLTTTAALLAAAESLSAALVNFSGDTTGRSVFFRTTESGFVSSQDVPFLAFSVLVDLTGSYDFAAQATGSPGFDTFISLYTPNFDPANSDTNWLISNDGALPTSSAFSYSLNAGTSYTFVMTGFLGAGAPDEGPFSATVSGLGTAAVAAIPEPSSALTGILSAGLGFAFCSRRKSWKKRTAL